MFKLLFVAAAFVALSTAAPEPQPKAVPAPAANPQFLAAAYAAPVVAAPAVAYTDVAYAAPLTYAGYYPSAYAAGYSAYSPYAATVVV
ncbi:unnamed protein product [Acanthoscelides obtectus]|uniref:Neuropeptide-like 4 n=1 Tax=Acanthoscelides obtectus TaxID=200917 RepID=A0A9P0KC05_ACAOB|nr:unnamed protein product [Acanthoscelides obtectus]CAK1676446.1 hypothetical protein AOBTE_LOCUS30762 [Acanthoscelides obtectus]